MEAIMHQLQAVVVAVVWPFCRFVAALAAAPVLGDAMISMRARALIALALAVTVQPTMPAMPDIDPISVRGVMLMAEQIMIGGLLGFSFHYVLAGLMVLGTLISSQMGLSMATLNDPVNGTPSDAMSNLLYLLFVLLFFSMDGHLLIIHVLARSFRIWPMGGGAEGLSLERFVHGVGWTFAVAVMMALPVVFVIMVAQMGMGVLQRVAPALNLFSLGFSIYTLFGLLLVLMLIPAIPDQFTRMMMHILDLIDSLSVRGSKV